MKPKKPARFKGGAITVLLLILCLSVSTTSAYMMASDSITTAFTIGEITPRISLAAELNEGIMVFPGTQLISSMFTVRAATGEILDPSEYTLSPEIAPGTIGTFSLKVLPVGSKYRQAVVDVPNESPEHVLEAGQEFNSRIPDTATSINFTDITAPSGATVTDVSAAKNGSVVSWVDGNTMYVSSQETGAKIIANVDASWMFYNKTTVSKVDLQMLDTQKTKNMYRMFASLGLNSSELEMPGLDDLNTSSVTNMQSVFCDMGRHVKNLNLGNIGKWDVSNVRDMSQMFRATGMYSETCYVGDLSNWDTSNVMDMSWMFNGFGSRATDFSIGNIGGWNTSNVTDMSHMFQVAGQYSETCYLGDIGKWDVSSVKNMEYMFNGFGMHNCVNFNIIDLSEWDVSGVKNMSRMFNVAGKSSSIWSVGDLSNWDVSSVTDMSHMFNGAYQDGTGTFDVGDLSGWDVSNVINMYMFMGGTATFASSVYIGDLSGWNTGNVTDMRNMFKNFGCEADYKQDFSGWNVSNVTQYASFAENVEDKIIQPNFS